MASLGIGLIGTGYMGKCHALAWNAVASVFGDVERPRLAVLAETSQALADEKARELGFARATGDWRSLVNDPAVDVVSITTPNAFHPDMAIAALEAGKHVWCEKPMATTLADAERMLHAARAVRQGRGARLQLHPEPDDPPDPQPARRRARIGDVNHVRIEMDEDFMADPEALFYWKSEASSGHGALDDFGVHALSLICGRCSAAYAGSAATWRRPYADRPLRAADGARSRPTTSPRR